MRPSLLLLTLIGCATARPVKVEVLCPPGTKVTIDGQLKGVGTGHHRLPPGAFVAQCGDLPVMELEVRPGSVGESFDFRGLAEAADVARGPEELFATSAPATLLLMVRHENRLSSGSGVIVDASGLVVTNRHVVDNVRSGGTLHAFLYGTTKPSNRQGSVTAFWRANADKAVKISIVRIHRTRDLALLRLEPRSEPYPFLKPIPQPGLKVGARVIAVGSPDGLEWSLSSGTISAIRKDWIQHQAPINPGNSGGPLIDDRGRFVGINTLVRNRAVFRGSKAVTIAGLGFAMPSSVVHSFLNDDSEADRVLRSAKTAEAEPSNDSVQLTKLLVGAVKAWGRTGDRPLALRAACDVLAATASGGRAGFVHRVNAAWINEGLTASLKQFEEPERGRLVALMAHHWPAVLYDALGQLWVLRDGQYHPSHQAKAWAVDDRTSVIYFAKDDGSLWSFRGQEDPRAVEGLAEVVDVQATDGMIYTTDAQGTVSAHRDGKTQPLGRAPASGFLLATRGTLYLLDRERDLFAFHKGKWLNEGKPIASHVLQVTAQGRSWYGLDARRRVYSGRLGRYIDNDGDAVALRAVNDDLLLFNEAGKLYRFDAESRRWNGMVGP